MSRIGAFSVEVASTRKKRSRGLGSLGLSFCSELYDVYVPAINEAVKIARQAGVPDSHPAMIAALAWLRKETSFTDKSIVFSPVGDSTCANLVKNAQTIRQAVEAATRAAGGSVIPATDVADNVQNNADKPNEWAGTIKWVGIGGAALAVVYMVGPLVRALSQRAGSKVSSSAVNGVNSRRRRRKSRR